MSPSYSDGARAWISSQVQVVSRPTSPSTVKVQAAGSRFGVGSALSTGQLDPVSYCPGGSLGSRADPPRPRNPRVILMAKLPIATLADRKNTCPARRCAPSETTCPGFGAQRPPSETALEGAVTELARPGP